MIDRPAAHIALGVVAGQLEVGYVPGHISQSGAADVGVVFDGHHRKVVKGPVVGDEQLKRLISGLKCSTLTDAGRA